MNNNHGRRFDLPTRKNKINENIKVQHRDSVVKPIHNRAEASLPDFSISFAVNRTFDTMIQFFAAHLNILFPPTSNIISLLRIQTKTLGL